MTYFLRFKNVHFGRFNISIECLYATGFSLIKSVSGSKLLFQKKINMEMESKRSRLNHEMNTSKQVKKVDWMKYLPEDVWNHVFLNYCDFKSIAASRMLQSKFVKNVTKSFIYMSAIERNNFKNVKWIYQSQGQFGGEMLSYTHFAEAAGRGSLNIMKWLKKKGCKMVYEYDRCSGTFGDPDYDSDTFSLGCGGMELKWNGAFAQAARYGDLNNMKWLHENGCPLDYYTFGAAAENGDLEILDWLLLNNCPYEEYFCFIYELSDSVIEWFAKHSLM